MWGLCSGVILYDMYMYIHLHNEGGPARTPTARISGFQSPELWRYSGTKPSCPDCPRKAKERTQGRWETQEGRGLRKEKDRDGLRREARDAAICWRRHRGEAHHGALPPAVSAKTAALRRAGLRWNSSRSHLPHPSPPAGILADFPMGHSKYMNGWVNRA